MSKFCTNCGNQLDDNVVVCPNCNTELTEEATAKKMPALDIKLLAIIGGAALVAIILVIVLLVNLLGGGYKKAVDNYVKMLKGDIKVVEKMAPEEYWEWSEDTFDMDIDDIKEQVEDADLLDELEDEYGKNIRISYKITDKDKLDEDDLDDLRDSLKDRYDIAKKDVKEALELELELTIKGSEDEDEDEANILAVKIRGDWYVCSQTGTFMMMMF